MKPCHSGTPLWISALLFGLLATGTSHPKAQVTATGRIDRIVVHGVSLEHNLGHLSADRAVLVYLPAGYERDSRRRYPVLYLLHGASATGHLLWTGNLANVQDIADRVFAGSTQGEMIVVMPDASSPYLGALYSNSAAEGNWEDFVARDLVNYVDAHYRTIGDRHSRGIAGHSRGGYGALRLALTRPDVFSVVYALSPCCTEPESDRRQLESAAAIHTPQDVEAARQRQPFGGPLSVLAQAAAWSPNTTRPPLYLDLPYEQGRDSRDIAAKWQRNSVLGLLDKHIGNLKKMRAIAFDVGEQDRAVSINGIVELDARLSRAMIDHTFEKYAGTHVNRVPERFETKVLPFFINTLASTQNAGLANAVKVQGGQLSGVPGKHAGITAFRGVPFAAPPVGNRRWQAPQPPEPWTGVRKAEAFGPSCIQTIVHERKPWTYEFMTHGEVSEDCLFVNIWTPATSASERKPVFVYIYGGGNNEGSGMVPVYDGEGLASKGLVVVNFNYRVGVLGFLAHPELSRESSYHASGNYGLLDQIAAVKWVHDNIAGFGGDPTRITVAGQSAGGQAVHNLTASPLAKGLFHRAIIESAGGTARPLADAEADGVRFAQAKGAATLSDLRAKSWQELVSPVPAAPAAAAGDRDGGNLRFGIVVDGYALPAAVNEIFAQGKQNDVPTIIGANADEGGASPRPTTTPREFERQARQRYGEAADKFLTLYPASTDDTAKIAQNQSVRDVARSTLHIWALNRGKRAKTNTFTYFWNHVLPGPDAARYGAFHTSEVPYVLNTLEQSDRPFTDADRKIAEMLSSYWAHFATSGDPNGNGLPTWPATDAKTWMTMELSERPHVIPVADSPAKRAFLERALEH